MKEPSLQHGMSAEFEITNKTQKEIQHSISLLASMVSAREFELLSNNRDHENLTLLSSLTGITKKRVQEKIMEEQATNSRNLRQDISQIQNTPSPKRQIDNLQSKDDSSPQIENLSDNIDDHAISIESFGQRRLLTNRAQDSQLPKPDNPTNMIRSLKGIDKLAKKKFESSPFPPQVKSPDTESVMHVKDMPATSATQAARKSRSKERFPLPISVFKSHMSKPSGDMDNPPL